jgi:hypothetical protein
MRVRVGSLVVVLLLAAAAAAEPEPRELYQELNALRVDPQQIYFVRDFHFRQDAVRFSLNEGKLGLLQSYDGRVFGAVFVGSGRVVAVPRDPGERRSLARFLGEPLLDQPFQQAYFRFTDGTGAELVRQIPATGARRLQEPTFVDIWETTLANLNPWHSLRTMQDLLSADPRPYFHGGLQSPTAGTFDVLVDMRREEAISMGQLRWVAGRRMYDVWASFPLEGGREQPAYREPFGAVAAEIETAIGADLGIEATATLRLRAATGGERMLSLELSRYFRVHEATDAEGRPLAYFQNDEVSREEIVHRGNDMLYVVLPAAPRAGEEFAVRLRYRGSVISDAGNNVYFVGERGSWYPRLAGPLEFIPYDLRFRWPGRLQLVATGRRVEEGQDGEWHTGRWTSEGPILLAGFNLGDYLSGSHTNNGWTIEVYANRQLEEALVRRMSRPVILIPSPMPQRRSTVPSQPRVVMMESPPAPSPSLALRQLGQDIGGAVSYYQELLGPFPFERLAISQIPGSFGQGWPGLLYLSTFAFLPPDVQRRAGLGERDSAQYSDLLPYHEVAHQWWGNLVGIGGYRHHWIHEGIANYLALLYAQRLRGNDKVLETWLEHYRKDLTSVVAGATADEIGPLSLGYRLSSSQMPDAYTRVVYGKGTWVVHMLRMMLRDPAAKDPDEKFFGLLRGLVESHRHRALTNEDLAEAVNRILPESMDLEGTGTASWFFDQWVRGTGIPRYTVEFQATQAGNGFRVRGTLKQDGVSEFFIAPVPLFAAGASGRPVRLGTVIADGPETRFEFTSRIRPRRIVVDPENTLLKRTD